MVEKFGVSLEEDLAARLEEFRVRGPAGERTVVSRSAAVSELLALGLDVTELIERTDGLDLSDERARRAFVRQAVLNEIAREGLEPPE